MAEPKIPEPKDDDPEDVADKLSIAAAMWSRGDRADAVSWLRRAAEAASDLELDIRALELAKTASELASLPPAGAAPAPPPAPAPVVAPAPAPVVAPAPAPPRVGSSTTRTAAVPSPNQTSSTAQTYVPAGPPPKPGPTKPTARPPESRPPGGKLPPLPPLRPLGTPQAAPTPAQQARSPRIPSMVSSVSGLASASGTIEKSSSEAETPKPSGEVESATKPMPWDDDKSPVADDEPTHQINLAHHTPPAGQVSIEEAPLFSDLDTTAVHEAIDPRLLQALRPGAASDGEVRAAAVIQTPLVPAAAMAPEPQASEPPPTRLPFSGSPFPNSEDGRSTREPPYLPLAVGLRVRLVSENGAIRVVPDDGSVDGGTPAILVPANPDDDLRAIFGRARRDA